MSLVFIKFGIEVARSNPLCAMGFLSLGDLLGLRPSLGWGLPAGGGWLALRALDFSAIFEGAAPVVPCDGSGLEAY